jgi:diguanylate cyclase (GGDEF)-like protein
MVCGIFIKLFYGHPANRPYPERRESTGTVPNRGDLDSRPTGNLGENFRDPGLARSSRLCLGYRDGCDQLERSCRRGLSDIPPAALSSGAGLAGLIEPDRSVRTDALGLSPPAHGAGGTPYRIEYGVRANISAPVLWIEETGCWFAGSDGKPVHAQGIVRINNERRARDEQLLKLSRNDPLTGELNRTHLVAALAEAIEQAQRFRTSCAFMLIGIDHLARINDAFGFDVADAVISEIAGRIRARLRGGDILGRFSGNKFGLILKNCTVDDMNVAAERFLASVRDDVVPTRSGPVSVTVSIGAISAPRYARLADEAINRAQEALDGAKRRRAGSFAMWRPMSSATRSAGSISASPTRS